MKRGTPNHPKVTELARRLGLTQYAAVGLLELLWHFTADYAKAGDIGKHSDEAIAQAMKWDQRPSDLIEALVGARWLDRSEQFRLLVHDWFGHCEDAIHIHLARAVMRFATGEIPKLSRLSKAEQRRLAKAFMEGGDCACHERTENAQKTHCQAQPSPAKPGPSQAMPSQAQPSPATAAAGGSGLAASGNGAGGRVGNGNLNAEAALLDGRRRAGLADFFRTHTVSEKVQGEWLERRDVNKERLVRELASVNRGANVHDPIAVLVNRINKRSK